MTRTTPTGVEAKRQATLLANFMKARHNIYLKKQADKPRPWTDDWVLDTFRFCNVYRELDTVTEWVAANIRKPFADSPHLWWMLAAARQINWPGTLQALIEQPKSAKAWPHNQRGAPAFDPAAMVRGGSRSAQLMPVGSTTMRCAPKAMALAISKSPMSGRCTWVKVEVRNE